MLVLYADAGMLSMLMLVCRLRVYVGECMLMNVCSRCFAGLIDTRARARTHTYAHTAARCPPNHIAAFLGK